MTLFWPLLGHFGPFLAKNRVFGPFLGPWPRWPEGLYLHPILTGYWAPFGPLGQKGQKGVPKWAQNDHFWALFDPF